MAIRGRELLNSKQKTEQQRSDTATAAAQGGSDRSDATAGMELHRQCRADSGKGGKSRKGDKAKLLKIKQKTGRRHTTQQAQRHNSKMELHRRGGRREGGYSNSKSA